MNVEINNDLFYILYCYYAYDGFLGTVVYCSTMNIGSILIISVSDVIMYKYVYPRNWYMIYPNNGPIDIPIAVILSTYAILFLIECGHSIGMYENIIVMNTDLIYMSILYLLHP